LSGTFSDVNLMNAQFVAPDGFLVSRTFFSGTFTLADFRGASATPDEPYEQLNLIDFNGAINGITMDTASPGPFTIRNYHDFLGATANFPVRVSDHMQIDSGATLQFVFDDREWGSTIGFAAGIPVGLGGTLDLEVDPAVDPATLIGAPFRIFDWTGVTPIGSFSNVTTDLSPAQYLWDTSELYSEGEVTLVAVPEPATWLLAGIGAWALARRRPRRLAADRVRVPMKGGVRAHGARASPWRRNGRRLRPTVAFTVGNIWLS
jgi:hypothetical protein